MPQPLHPWKNRTGRLVMPLLRWCLQHAPRTAAKRYLWTHVIDPHFAWGPHEFIARTAFGSRVACRTSDIIQQYIYYFGVWEPQLTHLIRQRLQAGDTFVDVGANIGYFALLASRAVGSTGRVVAIEASPSVFAALRRNLDLNKTSNVRALNVAASDHEGRVKLFCGPDSNIGQTTTVDRDRFAIEGEVGAAPLRALLAPADIARTRIIKIDVEGAEWAVVLGFGDLLQRAPRDVEIVVEIHPELLARQGLHPGCIMEWFGDAGFYAYSLETDYSPLSYLAPDLTRSPRRVQGKIEQEAHVVFSRRDVEVL